MVNKINCLDTFIIPPWFKIGLLIQFEKPIFWFRVWIQGIHNILSKSFFLLEFRFRSSLILEMRRHEKVYPHPLFLWMSRYYFDCSTRVQQIFYISILAREVKLFLNINNKHSKTMLCKTNRKDWRWEIQKVCPCE